MTTQPVIGFTLDYEEGGQPPVYSKMPWYALRENYCGCVSKFGAIPLPLPHEVALVDAYLDRLNGLIVTGGAFDVSPELYGEATTSDTVITKDRRTRFEFAITRGAIERKMPILGICGGQQLLNVVLGGTLIQHIPDTIPNALAHEQPNPRTEPGHSITISEGTLLHTIIGKTSMAVNSAHHQAVAQPAPNCIVDAVAPDGVIEGIEMPVSEHPFCLGVQWHPEYAVTPDDDLIIKAFIKAAKQYNA
jgi:putative glutamine amidotransferase